GDPLVSHAGPLLPLAQTPKMPASAQAIRMPSMSGSLDGTLDPQELLMMCGRRAGSGFSPARSVGASIHCADAARCASEHTAQPLAAIHVTPGATPMRLPSPPSPAMVPIVCVPCEFVAASNGCSLVPVASNQL